jgi:phosphotransferase system enzyme I (PtsI)
MEKNINIISKEYLGLSISSGKVYAPVCLYSAGYHKKVEEYIIADDQIEQEVKRFYEALKESSEELDKISKKVTKSIGKAESEIFFAQKDIMYDPVIVNRIVNEIKTLKKNAEAVVSYVYNEFEEKFKKMDNVYLRERGSDIREIKQRIINNLTMAKKGFTCEGQEHCKRGANRIVVAEEFTAEMMAHMNYENVVGIITEHGGVSSHGAIIARSLGIPSVTGVMGVTQDVKCGDMILLDGDSGKVFLNPSKEIVDKIITVVDVKVPKVCYISTPQGYEVMANTSLPEDVKLAKKLNADGIGLFRTEIMFIMEDRLLSEDEQYERYKNVCEIMENKIVTFRLLDVGGDKPLPFLRIKKESNPYLGWRGARFLLGNPDIFYSQVKALARSAKKHKIRILFPMVVDEIQQKMLIEATREVIASVAGASENIMLGTMFEVPSACLHARQIFKLIDFASIGSNDLIQYLLAVDRNNEMVSSDYNPNHPALWELLRQIVFASQEANKPLSVCGEMAGRKDYASRLAEIGIKSFSVSPRLIPQVRNEIAEYLKSKKVNYKEYSKEYNKDTIQQNI